MAEYIDREALISNLKKFANEQLTPLIENKFKTLIERDCTVEVRHGIYGIKRCAECEQNIRCSECALEGKNEILLKEIEKLKIENQSLRAAANSYKIHYNKARTEAVKDFAEILCKDRISNDPVVIAVKIELKEWLGDTE